MSLQKEPPSERIQHLIDRVESLRAERAELEALEKPLTAVVERLVEQLSGVPPQFFVVHPRPGSVDKGTEKKLVELSLARGKLEVLPGARFDCGKRLAVAEAELVKAADDEWRRIRGDARERYLSERANQTLALADPCGRDARRVNAAVDSVMANSEVARWLNDFVLGALPADALMRGRQVLRCRDFFDAGRTLSSAFKP